MKLVYSHENSVVTGNIKNLLLMNNIEVTMKNEFASGAVGDLGAFDAWIEIWIVNDKDENKALAIIEQAKENITGRDWYCKQCKELNAGSFELCWNCQHDVNDE